MALNIEKKKKAQAQADVALKSKGVNNALWIFAVLLIIVAAVGNVYFAQDYSAAIRFVGVVVLLVVAFALLAITNQGVKARGFFKESRTELRRITWPTRPEAMQTTLMIMAITVVVSLILWGLDSIIVSLINFVTELRF